MYLVYQEIFFAQRFVLAQEALELGIVNRVFPAAKLRDEVVTFAKYVPSREAVTILVLIQINI